VEDFVAGPPTDHDVTAVLAKPTGPIANDVFSPAFNNCLIAGPGKDPAVHRESNVRDFRVPAFFWR
jgi:hypothetical protein